MRPWLRILCAIVLLIGVVAYFLDRTPPPATKAPFRIPGEEIDMAYLPVFLKTAAAAKTIVLHEGLPHPTWDPELFKQEKKRHDIRQIHGFDFYAEPLALSENDAAGLTGTLARKPLFEALSVGKLCGGFHPDYAVEWRAENESAFALICFGCEEAKLYSASGKLYCDIPHETVHILSEILRKYRKNRPTAEPKKAAE